MKYIPDPRHAPRPPRWRVVLSQTLRRWAYALGFDL